MRSISWSDLGSPLTPGEVLVPGLGIVEVSQLHVDRAASFGGRMRAALIKVTSQEGRTRYQLGSMNEDEDEES